jgi:hypothetical protein
MTHQQIQENIVGLGKIREKVCQTPGLARRYLRDAGIIRKFATRYQRSNTILTSKSETKSAVAKWIVTRKKH